MSTSTTLTSSKNPVWQLALLAGLIVIILFRAPLTESLWLDETVTYWVIKDALSDAIHRSANYQSSSSLYYVALWAMQKIVGESELGLRLLSLLATAGSCLLVYTIGKNLWRKEVGLLSVFFFICQDITQKLAFSARPYALAVLFVLWSMLALLLWLQNGKRAYQVQYILATLAAIYTHYLLTPVLIVHLLTVVIAPSRNTARLRSYFFVMLPCIFLLFIPGILHMFAIRENTETLKFMIDQGLSDFLSALLPLNVAAYLGISIIFARVYDRFSWASSTPVGKHSIGIIIFWAFFPATLLFLYSQISSGSMFVDRYYSWAGPATALLLAWFVSNIGPIRARRNIILVFVLMAALREVQHQWNVEDWRRATDVASKAVDGHPGVPILAHSGLIELEQLSWYRDTEKAAYLNAPFSKYPLPQKAELLPTTFENQAATTYVQEILKRSPHFVLISLRVKREVQPDVWRYADEYLTDYFTKQGYAAAPLEEKNLVRVFEFSRKTN